MSRIPALLALGLLSACAARGGGMSGDGDARYGGLSCAPFARELTGLRLTGDAASWWTQADGRYARAHRPDIGAVLVFAQQSRLPSGHVSVVSRLLDGRRIDVIQANWVRHELARDELVVDVSADNDWTLVRVWWPPIAALGSHPYVTDGFILPPAPLSSDALARAAEPAAARAAGGG